MVKKKRIGIFVISYNAESTIRSVLNRIPPKVWRKAAEVFIIDDHSPDNTYKESLAFKKATGLKKLKVFRNSKNLGYGGNQKKGYNYAISKGFDIVAMLHGDGQYAPEKLDALIEPLEKEQADMVFGSRMRGNPLQGRMPLYKYVGNKLLTFLENTLLGLGLSEYHSGYRVYSCKALKQIPFNLNTDGFHFDTEIIIQFKERGLRIAEKPIPTFYGDEISNVKVLDYGLNVLKAAARYRLHKLGIIYEPKYDLKNAAPSMRAALRTPSSA